MPSFRGTRVTNETISACVTPSWKRLELLDTLVDDNGICRICDIATRLTEVVISSRILTDRSLQALCHIPGLCSLFIENAPQISDVGVADLSHALQLRELRLRGTHLTDAGAESIAKLCSLWSLDLSGTKLTNTGVRSIATMRSLRLVVLDDLTIDGHGLEDLPNGNRTSLYLERSMITDAGISEYLRHDRLVAILSLSDTLISDRSIPKLSALPMLSDIRLDGTCITDSGIAAFIGHGTIDSIYVERTAVTPEMLERIKDSIPRKVRVYR